MCLSSCLQFFWGGVAGSYGSPVFRFLSNHQAVFHSSNITSYIPTSIIGRLLAYHHMKITCLSVKFWQRPAAPAKSKDSLTMTFFFLSSWIIHSWNELYHFTLQVCNTALDWVLLFTNEKFLCGTPCSLLTLCMLRSKSSSSPPDENLLARGTAKGNRISSGICSPLTCPGFSYWELIFLSLWCCNCRLYDPLSPLQPEDRPVFHGCWSHLLWVTALWLTSFSKW